MLTNEEGPRRLETVLAPDEFKSLKLKVIEDFVVDTQYILGQGKYGNVYLA